MTSAVATSLEEYLETTYRPDREYIDGEIREKHMGSWEHSRVQALLVTWFCTNEAAWGTTSATEWRTQVSETRIRLPDVIVTVRRQQPRVQIEPPLLAVEILSPEDTYAETMERTRDYSAMGVLTSWIIDPQARIGWMGHNGTWVEATRLHVPDTNIYVELVEIFDKM